MDKYTVLSKIEKLIGQLDYQYVKIELEMKDQETLVFEKENKRKAGFCMKGG